MSPAKMGWYSELPAGVVPATGVATLIFNSRAGLIILLSVLSALSGARLSPELSPRASRTSARATRLSSSSETETEWTQLRPANAVRSL